MCTVVWSLVDNILTFQTVVSISEQVGASDYTLDLAGEEEEDDIIV